MSPLRDRDAAPVVDHLEELRWRVAIVFAVLIAGMVAAYAQFEHLSNLLERPLGGDYSLLTLSVTEPFFTKLSVSAQAAILLALPVGLYQAWRFVAPALPADARRGVRGILVATPAFFTAGVVFGFAFVLAPAVRFLLGIAPGSFDVNVRASEYYSFVTTTLLSMGLAFCFPLVLLGLARVGVLGSARLRSSRRIAYVLISVIAALLPTADPVSLAIEMLPLVGLYELSIITVRVQERMLERRAAAAAAAGGDDEPAA